MNNHSHSDRCLILPPLSLAGSLGGRAAGGRAESKEVRRAVNEDYGTRNACVSLSRHMRRYILVRELYNRRAHAPRTHIPTKVLGSGWVGHTNRAQCSRAATMPLQHNDAMTISKLMFSKLPTNVRQAVALLLFFIQIQSKLVLIS